jgi:hypothetical protein
MKAMNNAHASQHRYNYLGGTLCRYLLALERGDADLLQAILYEAEQDEALERMITEVHRAERSEEDEAAFPQLLSFLHVLLQQWKQER